MKEIKFTLNGSVPSKKNSRQMFVRNGKIMNVPSKAYQSWHKSVNEQIATIAPDKIDGQIKILCEFWVKDNRATDIDNKIQSVLDALKDFGIIEDDCWQIVPDEHAVCMGIDKLNPRVDVTITSIDKP